MPWEGHRDLLTGLEGPLTGKIVIDCVNPLGFDKRPFRSGVEPAAPPSRPQAVLPGSRVGGASYDASAVALLDPEVTSVDLDVMVLGDDREATDLVQELAARIPGVRGIYAGRRLRNCGQVEALTANLVSINRRYSAHAGLLPGRKGSGGRFWPGPPSLRLSSPLHTAYLESPCFRSLVCRFTAFCGLVSPCPVRCGPGVLRFAVFLCSGLKPLFRILDGFPGLPWFPPRRPTCLVASATNASEDGQSKTSTDKAVRLQRIKYRQSNNFCHHRGDRGGGGRARWG